jgi:hypothetical protein
LFSVSASVLFDADEEKDRRGEPKDAPGAARRAGLDPKIEELVVRVDAQDSDRRSNGLLRGGRRTRAADSSDDASLLMAVSLSSSRTIRG